LPERAPNLEAHAKGVNGMIPPPPRSHTPTAADFFLAAKREVMLMARQGLLMSPNEAWRLAGESKGRETLWSIAYRIGTTNDVSAEVLNDYLERQFPLYTKHADHSATWDDIRY
jgi:hypothetical protein